MNKVPSPLSFPTPPLPFPGAANTGIALSNIQRDKGQPFMQPHCWTKCLPSRMKLFGLEVVKLLPSV